MHHAVPSPNIDGATVGELDAVPKDVVRSLVVDMSKATVVADEARACSWSGSRRTSRTAAACTR